MADAADQLPPPLHALHVQPSAVHPTPSPPVRRKSCLLLFPQLPSSSHPSAQARHRRRASATVDRRLWSSSGHTCSTPSTAALWGTSPASTSSLTSTTSTPHRSFSSRRDYRHCEPTPVRFPPSKGPNWVPPPLELVSWRLILWPRRQAGRISPASRRRRGGGDFPPLFSPCGPKQLRGLGHVGSELRFGVSRRKASPAVVRPWATSGPRGRIYLKFSFRIYFGIP
jgi:hypothetical protein